jgi:hypothetical protein
MLTLPATDAIDAGSRQLDPLAEFARNFKRLRLKVIILIIIAVLSIRENPGETMRSVNIRQNKGRRKGVDRD